MIRNSSLALLSQLTICISPGLFGMANWRILGELGRSKWLEWADRKGREWDGKGHPHAHESNLAYRTLRMSTTNPCLEGYVLSLCLGTKVCLDASIS